MSLPISDGARGREPGGVRPQPHPRCRSIASTLASTLLAESGPAPRRLPCRSTAGGRSPCIVGGAQMHSRPHGKASARRRHSAAIMPVTAAALKCVGGDIATVAQGPGSLRRLRCGILAATPDTSTLSGSRHPRSVVAQAAHAFGIPAEEALTMTDTVPSESRQPGPQRERVMTELSLAGPGLHSLAPAIDVPADRRDGDRAPLREPGASMLPMRARPPVPVAVLIIVHMGCGKRSALDGTITAVADRAWRKRALPRSAGDRLPSRTDRNGKVAGNLASRSREVGDAYRGRDDA